MLGPVLLREKAERRMVDACTITRNPAGAGNDAYDRDTEQLTPQASPVYAGRCVLFAPHADRLGRATVAESDQAATVLGLGLPLSELDGHGEKEPRVGDLVHMDSSVYDPNLAGRDLIVTELLRESYATFRACRVRSV